jgi:hypothetical protein
MPVLGTLNSFESGFLRRGDVFRAFSFEEVQTAHVNEKD